jgi:adenylate cyclase
MRASIGPVEVQKRILIVDDDETIRELLGELVRLEGYYVATAESPRDALRLLSDSRFDAFLLDVDMPGGDGISLCRAIRGIQQYEASPILFITGNTDGLEEAFAAGCDDYISKPVDHRVLRARLNGHMERREQAVLLSTTRRLLDQYVSRRTREIVEKAALTGELPEPERRNVVVLFTDIRGFTALSEEVDPVALFSLVSAELATQVNLVYEYGGYVDKFGGDGLLAVFDGEDMAQQSCLCAMELIRQASLASTEASAGDSRIKQLGIGIHMGPVVIGNIGASSHLDYSVIGIAVNLAARLCGHAEPLTAVVSKAVRDAVLEGESFTFTNTRSVAIRGLKDLVTVYTLAARL